MRCNSHCGQSVEESGHRQQRKCDSLKNVAIGGCKVKEEVDFWASLSGKQRAAGAARFQ